MDFLAEANSFADHVAMAATDVESDLTVRGTVDSTGAETFPVASCFGGAILGCYDLMFQAGLLCQHGLRLRT